MLVPGTVVDRYTVEHLLGRGGMAEVYGVRHAVLVERDDAVGGAWRRHYDRLHLHTPKGGSALPGLSMPADWPRYASREQVVA